MTTLVVPLRHPRPDPDPAPYAARSLIEAGYADRVVTVGAPVDWSDQHIDVEQDPTRGMEITNTRLLLDIVLGTVGGSMIWTDDDTFALKAPKTLPLYARQEPLRTWAAKLPAVSVIQAMYRAAAVTQVRILEAWDIPEPDNYEIHTPIRVNPTELRELLEKADRTAIEFGVTVTGWRSLWGNTRGRKPTRITDPKFTAHRGLPGSPWASLTRMSWQGQTGRMLRERFTPYQTESSP